MLGMDYVILGDGDGSYVGWMWMIFYGKMF
jgi:hypothetical protein